jgi:ABC-type nickel/cobalt efflux system permease component RcnA
VHGGGKEKTLNISVFFIPMAVYEALYYGYAGVAVLVMLLILYIIHASTFIFTTDNNILKYIAYITVLFAAWLIGVIYGSTPMPADCRQDKDKKNS